MIEVWHLLVIIPLCLGFGYIFGEVMENYNRKRAEIKLTEKRPEDDPEKEAFPEDIKLDPMMLRNGSGVTRCENPTFAEQIVNIMNYSGKNQKEGDYEPGEDYTSEHLG